MTDAPPIRAVSGTAFIIAAFRARGAEGASEKRLYHDPITPLLLTADARHQADAAAATFPPAPHMVAVRTRYFDDAIQSALDAGTTQVLVLGSGLDTRPVRLHRDGVRWYEIDRAETLAYKARTLAAHGFTPNCHPLPGDYLKMDLAAALDDAGLNRDAPTFVLWEGNTAYLTHAQITATLAAVARLGDPGDSGNTRVTVALDVMAQAVIDGTTGHDDLDDYIAHLARMGAPWHSGYDDLAPLAAATGYTVSEQPTAADLHRAYRPNDPVPSPMFDFYRMATLTR